MKATLLDIVDSIPKSATALAKLAGYSKASQIMDALEELVQNGDIIKDETGRFPVYTKAVKAVKKAKSKKSVVSSSEEVTVVSAASDTASDTAPTVEEDNLDHICGYTLKPAKNKAGQKGKKVTFPDGKRIAFVPEGSSLLVINDNYHYIVNTPANVFNSIGAWTREKGYSTFTVTQLKVGNIAKASDLKMLPILLIKIEKVNKAAK